MSGFSDPTPNINATTPSAQLRVELLNTFTRLGGQLSQAPYSLYNSSSIAGNTAGAETTLTTTTINFGTLQLNGSSLLILAAGRTAANANTKTLKLVFGGSNVFSITGAYNNAHWVLQSQLIRTGGSSQTVCTDFRENLTGGDVNVNTLSVALASNQILKITGNGTAASDVQIYFMKVLLLN